MFEQPTPANKISVLRTAAFRLIVSQHSLSLRLDKYQNIATALSFDNVSVMRCFIFDNVFVMRYSIFNNNAKSRPLRVIIIIIINKINYIIITTKQWLTVTWRLLHSRVHSNQWMWNLKIQSLVSFGMLHSKNDFVVLTTKTLLKQCRWGNISGLHNNDAILTIWTLI